MQHLEAAREDGWGEREDGRRRVGVIGKPIEKAYLFALVEADPLLAERLPSP